MAKTINGKFFYEPGDVVVLLESCHRAIVTEVVEFSTETFHQRVNVSLTNGKVLQNVDAHQFDLLFKAK